MSRYPDNPYWCQEHDDAYFIASQHDWDDASLQGYLTVEHVLLRLQAMLEFELGDGASKGYTEDGFLSALVADAVMRVDALSVHIYPNDHPPPHVHVRFKGQKHRLRLAIPMGDVLPGDDIPAGWAKQLRKVSDLVVESGDMLMTRWTEMHPADP